MVTLNPYVITNVQDGFSVQSQGFWQGDVQADPATRFQIAPGVIAASETLPMWGGIAVYEQTPAVTPVNAQYLGSTIGRAINNSSIAGFSTFNGSYSLPTTPQSPVPMGSPGNSYNYVRTHTNNRIVVAAAPGILALAGSSNPQQFSWDIVNQQLLPYQALGTGVAISTAVWALGVLDVVTSAAHGLTTGAYATITGAVPYGYNVSGTVTVISATEFTIAAPVAPGGALSTPGNVAPGLGGFYATLVQVDTNSAIVNYNASTGFATWNTSANAAVILLG